MIGWIIQCESEWTTATETAKKSQYLSRYFTYQRLIPDQAQFLIRKRKEKAIKRNEKKKRKQTY